MIPIPDLSPVSQSFTADVEAYLTQMDRLIAKNRDVIASIGEVQAAINDLEGKTVDIDLNVAGVTAQVDEIKELINGIDGKEVTVLVKYVSEGQPDAIQGALGGGDNAQGVMSDYLQALRDEAVAMNAERNAAAAMDAELNKLGEDGRNALDSLAEAYNLAWAESAKMTEEQANIAEGMLQDMHMFQDTSEAAGSLASRLGIVRTEQEAWNRAMADLEEETAKMISDTDHLSDSIGDGFAPAILRAMTASEQLENGLKKIEAPAQDASNAVKDLGTAAVDSIPSWFSWTRQLQTFGGALEMVLGKQVPLVTSIAAWHLVLDSVLEGTIALAGALIALGAAAAGMAPSMLDIYNHLVATRDVIEAFGVEVKPFNQWFLNLQHAMQTDSIELYGEALLDLGKANGTLATSIENVGQAIDRIGAKISASSSGATPTSRTRSPRARATPSNSGMRSGNLIVTINHLLLANTEIVHYVLDFVDAFTGALAAVTGFSARLNSFSWSLTGSCCGAACCPSFVINLGLVFLRPLAQIAAFVTGTKAANTALGELAATAEETGVAATPFQNPGAVLQDLLVAFVNVGLFFKTWAGGIATAMTEADGAVATGAAGMKAALSRWEMLSRDYCRHLQPSSPQLPPWGIWLTRECRQPVSAKSLGAALQAQVSGDNASQAILDTTAAIGKLNQQISTTTPAAMGQAATSAESFGVHFQAAGEEIEGTGAMFGKAIASVPEALSSWPALGHTITSSGDTFKSIVTGSGAATQAASQNINYYKGLIPQFTGAQPTLFKVAGATMQQNSVGCVQALGLMDAAGVTSGETFQEDMTQVEGLIQGYENNGELGDPIGNSINTITLQTEQQETEISQITGAWTNFINLVTGGKFTFVTVAQQVQGTMAAAGGAARRVSRSATER